MAIVKKRKYKSVSGNDLYKESEKLINEAKIKMIICSNNINGVFLFK